MKPEIKKLLILRQPVTHITTTPTTTETQPILPVIHKEIFKELT